MMKLLYLLVLAPSAADAWATPPPLVSREGTWWRRCLCVNRKEREIADVA